MGLLIILFILIVSCLLLLRIVFTNEITTFLVYTCSISLVVFIILLFIAIASVYSHGDQIDSFSTDIAKIERSFRRRELSALETELFNEAIDSLNHETKVHKRLHDDWFIGVYYSKEIGERPLLTTEDFKD